jgi:Ca2+-binding RTX toxin-like protein
MATFTSADNFSVDFTRFDLDQMTRTTPLGYGKTYIYLQWGKSLVGWDNFAEIGGNWDWNPQGSNVWSAINSGEVTSYEFRGQIEQYSNTHTDFEITGFSFPATAMWTYLADAATYVFAGGDSISGSNVNDVLWGYGGDDGIYGRGGADALVGGAGSDVLDGGDGLDTALYSGAKTDYAVTRTTNGWTVRDLRVGSPDGTDTLVSIERLGFSDGLMPLDLAATANAVSSATVSVRTADWVTANPTTPYPAATLRTDTSFVFDFGKDKDGYLVKDTYLGYGFTYDAAGNPTGGTITGMTHYDSGGNAVGYTGVLLSVTDVVGLFRTGDTNGLRAYLLSGNDQISADGNHDKLHGYAGNDVIDGGSGYDVIYGDAGDDVIEGGAGDDIAAYDAAIANFQFSGSTKLKEWTWIVRDTRGNGLGVDTLTSIEKLQFLDKTVDLSKYDSSLGIATLNILQSVGVTEIDVMIGNGFMAKSAGLSALIARADATTSVATMSYQFFTGKIPTSGGIEYLVSPTGANANNLNSAYYQSFNLENRYINFAVNLGKVGEGKANFAAKYGALSLFDATKEAYKTIFGGTPTDAKVHVLIDTRVDYLASYGGDGANGIGTKAAMVGWLLAEAAKADIGMYSKASNAFLNDLADGAAFGIDLIGVYGRADYAYAG